MKLLVLDNYDSFTYNLVHMLRALGVHELEVIRNNKISLDAVQKYDSVVLSPGPGIPSEAGIMPDLVRKYSTSKKILGVCLGHQCIGEVFGAELENLGSPVHGKGVKTNILDSSDALFKGIPNSFVTGRYHSWVINKKSIPEDLTVIAKDELGEVMAIRHKKYNIVGVQFHPESVLTEFGAELMKNWLEN